MNLNLKVNSKIINLVLFCLVSFGIKTLLYAQITDNFANKLKTGADRSELYLPLLKGKKVIVLTNQTGVLSDKNNTHLVDFLLSENINIIKIFTPEHGFRGDYDAGKHINHEIDEKTGIKIISLYGKNKKPTKKQVSDADVILFDLQDVGVRFYTYISTLSYTMEIAAEMGIDIVVLDRPNPHDGYIDGPVLDKKWTSFVGMHPIPVIYGLTIGEYGLMVNGEKWLKNGMKAKYHLIKLQNYHKQQRYKIAVKPSPNLRNDKAINLYPSLCFFEGTNISIGRGTEFPFQIYGSPNFSREKYDFKFTPIPSSGAKNPPLNGKECFGKDLRNSAFLTELNLEWLINAYENTQEKSDFFLKNLLFDKLAGSDKLRKQIINGVSLDQIKNSWKEDLEKFDKIRKKYVVYPN